MARDNRGSQLLSGGSSRGRGKASTSRGGSYSSVQPPAEESADKFAHHRLENAAKRTERGSIQSLRGRGRGNPRGPLVNKYLDFNEQKVVRSSKPSTSKTTIQSSAMASNSGNSFASSSGTFNLSSAATNTFGVTPQAPSLATFGTTSTFGSVSQSPNNIGGVIPSFSNPFGPSSAKHAATMPHANPFATKKPATPSASFGTKPQPTVGNALESSHVGSAQSNPFSNVATVALKSSPTPFGAGATSVQAALDVKAARGARFGTNTIWGAPTPSVHVENGTKPVVKIQAPQTVKSAIQSTAAKPTSPPDTSSRSSKSLAKKVEAVLQAERIIAPEWPGLDMENRRAANLQPQVMQYFQDYKTYQGKARKALMKAKLIDNPEIRKTLSEAIDFKGTCEEMCPQLEKADRIVSTNIDNAEKEDGSLPAYPVLEKMVKVLARSSAGQEAPLPEDIRSTAALRRTVDYLFETVLGNAELSDVYTFLWDRTRAVRRDFVFHSVLSQSELYDQVNCLERIVRFHTMAAHHMSHDSINNSGFVEQQELEQLGKTFLSLMDTYEQCSTQGILCDNEVEFKSYYVLWCARSNPGIIEEVQSWDRDMWKHEEIQLAVSLVEALQTPWDILPIKSHAETDIASNAFSRFFYVIGGKEVSYTMACLAETFFNHVRFSILTTVVKSYRRQKQQSTAWTISKLNKLLHFDNEDEVNPFCERHGLNFEVTPDGNEYLSFESNSQVTQPWPPLKQGYSYNIVEKKRGHYSLTEAINRTLYDESSEDLTFSMQDNEPDEEDSLFVKDDSAQPLKPPKAAENLNDATRTAANRFKWMSTVPAGPDENVLPLPDNIARPVSISDQIQAPKPSHDIFALPSPLASTTSSQPLANPGSLFYPQQSLNGATPTFGAQPVTQVLPVSGDKKTATEVPFSKPPSTFSFLKQAASPKVPIVNNGQAPKTVTPFGGLYQPLSSQHDSPSASFVPNVQPQKEKPATSSDIQSLGLQILSSPFTGFAVPPSISNSTPDPEVATAVKTLPAAVEPNQDELLVPSASGFPPEQRSAKLTAVSEWVALGIDGLLQQFIENQVELILLDTVQIYLKEEAIKSAREADERAVVEADHFRFQKLAVKYGRRWRENARVSSLKRRGRVARQARREFAESFRSSKAAKSASLVEDFRASTTSRRRQSLASLLDDTGVLDLVHNSNSETKNIVNGIEPSPKRHRSEQSTSSVTSTARRHRHGESGQQNPLRRSLMSDPTYLQGGSRIHLISDYDAKKEFNPQLSGVATDYFRLKARGITTLPDGTPLATSATNNPARRKRSLDGFVRPETPRQARVPTDAQSVPTKHSKEPAASQAEIQALKANAKSIMADDRLSRYQKRAYVDDDDDELFERAKRVREQMDEGADWFRQEMQRETASRSVS